MTDGNIGAFEVFDGFQVHWVDNSVPVDLIVPHVGLVGCTTCLDVSHFNKVYFILYVSELKPANLILNLSDVIEINNEASKLKIYFHINTLNKGELG